MVIRNGEFRRRRHTVGEYGEAAAVRRVRGGYVVEGLDAARCPGETAEHLSRRLASACLGQPPLSSQFVVARPERALDLFVRQVQDPGESAIDADMNVREPRRPRIASASI